MSQTGNAPIKGSAYRRSQSRRTLSKIQENVVKQGKRNAVHRFVLSKSDKDKIAAWNRDLARVLDVFNVRSVGSVGDPRTYQHPFRPSWRSIPT